MAPATKVEPFPLPSCTVVVPDWDEATTCTEAVPTWLPAVAVTVMVRSEESPAVLSVATAEPFAPVLTQPFVPFVTATPPEEALKQT
ncbi:MAG TPA: hypothetical protein VGG53_07415 [Mycobacterium sp.]